MGTEVPLFNPNDRLGVRDGGPYLDIEELKAAEVRRAAVEGREPDFDNLIATAGVPLQTAGQQAATANVSGISSQAHVDASGGFIAAHADDDKVGPPVYDTLVVPDEDEVEANPVDPTEFEGVNASAFETVKTGDGSHVPVSDGTFVENQPNENLDEFATKE